MHNIGVRAYALLLNFARFFHPKAKAWVEGRKNWKKQLPALNGQDVYWFHCASLGEFDQGIPVMNYLREHLPDAYIVTTFFSPSGMEHYHKRNHPCDFVCYLPIDTPKNASHFVTHFKPKVSLFVKYEFWENHINAAKKQGSQIYSISTLFRPNQHFFKPIIGKISRGVLFDFDHFFVQNDITLKLLNSIGITKATLTGDTRFDRVLENKKQLQPNTILIDFVGNSANTLIAGSVWNPDLDLLESTLKSNQFTKTIIAPHQINEGMIQSIIDRFPHLCERYTTFANENKPILILDTIGHLASAYSYGQLAYVGGGFSGQLHNILEPAVFGLPVIFGPKHSKFPEAALFKKEGIGFSISTPEEFDSLIERLNSENLAALSNKTAQFVAKNTGASAKIGQYVISNLKS